MNKVFLIGRLTGDPEVRYTNDENPIGIARYTMAVNRRIKKDGENEADFIRCVTFGKNADFVNKYLRKGAKIAISGRIQTGSYTNKDGQKVYTTDVIVEEHEFCETKGSQNGSSAPDVSAEDGFMHIPDGIEDELPFE